MITGKAFVTDKALGVKAFTQEFILYFRILLLRFLKTTLSNEIALQASTKSQLTVHKLVLVPAPLIPGDRFCKTFGDNLETAKANFF